MLLSVALFHSGKRRDSHTRENVNAQVKHLGIHPVEVLATYSHSTQAADLQLCHTAAVTNPARAPKPSAKRPGSLRPPESVEGRARDVAFPESTCSRKR
jgi:hypothetical protein